MRRFIKLYISFSIFLITFSSINPWTTLFIGNTIMWWSIYSTILFFFIISKPIYYDKSNDKNIIFIKLFLAWNIICVFRGFFVAENYWDWKNLINVAMVLLMPFIINLGTNKILVQSILNRWLKYALPAFFLLLPFMLGEAYGRYLVPISFLMLFFPIINNKWKIILLFFSFIVFFGYFDGRSNIIKFLIPFLISIVYYFRNLPIRRLINLTRIFFLMAPFLFFFLAIGGSFNIFKMEEYLGDIRAYDNTSGQNVEVKLTADTRTFLYQEVIASAIKYNYSFFGRTPARGNESASFGEHQFYELKTGRMERYGNEVSILNIFTWTGIVGVILYFLVFYWSSYLAIHKSNNIFVKLIGIYVAFRWLYAWVEDFSSFDLSNLILWIMISMCISESFRQMNDKEFITWVRGIFSKSYKQPIQVQINNYPQ